ncbi:hypothetical protein SAMN05660206_10753 [Sphingobacterium wenxiniae]|uniref:Uncharacterized protein n=1 Tax=Sphingobacterium wenxiniae TaxID=683125 RepID=A0A1I6TUC0_9SPHI|nr:hypothetical protein SAMN05660206_10753 [Sphingobacterium wenxiniae]
MSNPWGGEVFPYGIVPLSKGNEVLPMETTRKLLGSVALSKGFVLFSCLFFLNPKAFEINPEEKRLNPKGIFINPKGKSIKPKGNVAFFMKNIK